MDKRQMYGYIEDTFIPNKDSVVLRDSAGEILDKNKVLSMLKDSAGGDLPNAIIVEIEATHSGITKNFTEYMSQNMKRSAKSWTSPYNKPVLVNHDPYAPTLGRVKAHEFMRSQLNPEKDTIKLTLELTDPGTIKRHLDGTALTYSIGGSAKQIFCSICGCEIIGSDEFCGHWRGNTYSKAGKDGKAGPKEMCIWQIGDVEYLEVSEVNVPADVWAQVLNVKVKPEDNNDDSANETVGTKDAENINNLEVSKMADALLNSVNNEEPNIPASSTDASIADNTSDQPPVVDTGTPPQDDLSDMESISKKDLEDMKAKVTDLEKKEQELMDVNNQVIELADEVKKLKDEIVQANSAKEKAEKDLAESIEKSQQTYKVNVDLAKTLKKVYTDSIVDAKIVVGELDSTNSDSEKETLGLKSIKELYDILEELRAKVKCKVSPTKVTQANIGDEGALSLHQKNADVDATPKDKSVKPMTAEEAVNQIINAKHE